MSLRTKLCPKRMERDRDKWWEERDVSRTLEGPRREEKTLGRRQEIDAWEDGASTESSRELTWTPRTQASKRLRHGAGLSSEAERQRVPDSGQTGWGLRVQVRTADPPHWALTSRLWVACSSQGGDRVPTFPIPREGSPTPIPGPTGTQKPCLSLTGSTASVSNCTSSKGDSI